jgi:GAF domain-containing protein
MDERGKESPVSAVLYKRLLGFATHTDPRPLLDDAVQLQLELTGALLAFVELFDDKQQPRFWRGRGRTTDELDVLRASVSRGIVAHALTEGRTVQVTSALSDDRFAELESVRQREIEAVLCSPIGEGPARGFVYLHGRSAAGPFTEQDRELVELAALHVALVASRLVAERPRSFNEETREAQRRHLRASLDRCEWNRTRAADELGIARSHLYRLIREHKLREDCQ